MDQSGETEPRVHDIMGAAERVLSARLGVCVRLRAGELYTTGKSEVVRCHVVNPHDLSPETFIVKRPLPSDEFPSAHLKGLLNEWAAIEFLDSLGAGPPLAPRFYGGDERAGLIVMEDLGRDDGDGAQALVNGDDPALAEAALVEHASLIGRLHALTAGKLDEYLRIRDRVRLPSRETALFSDPWPSARTRKSDAEEVERVVESYRSVFRMVGLAASAGVEEEVALVTEAVEEEPGPFQALCQGDQNGVGSLMRAGDGPRLYDFDCAGFRHALLEGVPARTGWGCVMRLPERVAPLLERAYRDEFVKGCPAAADDGVFRRAEVEAAGRWHVFQVLTRLRQCLEEDAPRGPTTRRQQFLAWMDTFAATTDESARLNALGSSARALAARLRALWPAETHTLPPYPAFRSEQ